MRKRAALYCRVSTTNGQTTENQRLALEEYCERQGWSVVETYEDVGVSGATHDRDGLDCLKADCPSRKFDLVVTWKMDRLARSVPHLLEILSTLREYGIGFASLTESIDTETASGRMLVVFLAAISEFERELTKERVVCGLARARANGVTLGRPRRGFDVQRAIQLRDSGLGYKQIAKALAVPRTTLHRYMQGIPKSTGDVLALTGIP